MAFLEAFLPCTLDILDYRHCLASHEPGHAQQHHRSPQYLVQFGIVLHDELLPVPPLSLHVYQHMNIPRNYRHTSNIVLEINI
jgi:hypothetical protein